MGEGLLRGLASAFIFFIQNWANIARSFPLPPRRVILEDCCNFLLRCLCLDSALVRIREQFDGMRELLPVEGEFIEAGIVVERDHLLVLFIGERLHLLAAREGQFISVELGEALGLLVEVL